MDPTSCRRLERELGVASVESDDPARALRQLAPSDAIVMWHAIEHLTSPWDVLAACAENLRPGGVLAVSTPNPQALQYRLLKGRWAHVDAPRHLQLIPEPALRARANAFGLWHVRTVTTDPVGLECNRLGWEMALRRHPARDPGSLAIARASFLMTRLTAPLERHGLWGSTYTSVFTARRF
jgi:SAM-dependent methyltransferase